MKNPPTVRETWDQSLVGKIPWRRERQPTPVFLPGGSHGQRSLAGYSLWDLKLLNTTEHTHTNALTKFLNSYSLMLSYLLGLILISMR